MARACEAAWLLHTGEDVASWLAAWLPSSSFTSHHARLSTAVTEQAASGSFLLLFLIDLLPYAADHSSGRLLVARPSAKRAGLMGMPWLLRVMCPGSVHYDHARRCQPNGPIPSLLPGFQWSCCARRATASPLLLCCLKVCCVASALAMPMALWACSSSPYSP